MAPSSQSFQLPDILGVINSIELRTNGHCRYATEASEKWLTETGILSVDELSYIHPTKIGLLSALCFPKCDFPQLRVLTDFCMLFFYSGLRENAEGETFRLWDVDHSQLSAQIAAGSVGEMDYKSGLDLLKGHVLLRQLHQRLVNLASAASETWNARFKKSVLDYQAAQEVRRMNRSRNDVPSLEEYTATAREMHGNSVLLDLAELLEVFEFPDLRGTEAEKIIHMKHAALDVIAWSLDVVSYQLQQYRGSTYNLVAVLMHHNSLSVQGAMNQCGNMIKQAFSSFCSTERAILDSIDSSKSSILSWMWTAKEISADTEAISEKIKRYIRALKDCISAVIHWAYETELFFGKKGSEIRTFGWVFVDHIPVITE
ncbi:Sesquiterpene synthase Agr1 [Psilocybe cubensis]|uniref:Sesquiterpene synthase Agr1 n=2 Tax=Psilocybe cubensis TaxID=181762 RepID=A0ACB8GHT3_PSICU|nr:Sesquiterpene synthase Agr1 [Psilocybe cubensis]KAH9475066.1 Sesquiterpene synthase Agr1 [Psilocybe cubensis]